MLVVSCNSQTTEGKDNSPDPVNEVILYFPRNADHARTILKSEEGKFTDAILLLKMKGSPKDIPLIKDFLDRMKKDKNLYKMANYHTINNSGFEAMCLEAIKVLNSPNIKEIQNEMILDHPNSLEEARNVFQKAKGNFFLASSILEKEGLKKDIEIIENFLKLLERDGDLRNEVQQSHKDYNKYYLSIIDTIKKRLKL